jgi:outer membrane PBP1 activator LpoA protein
MKTINFLVSHFSHLLLIVTTAVLFAGCATSSERLPSEKIALANLMVVKAKESQAQQWAPLELNQAIQRIDQAKQALKNNQYQQAIRLAEQALLDASLAEAKAESAIAHQLFKKAKFN